MSGDTRVHLQDCGTIQLLEPFLRAGQPGPMQLEALSALYNLCKISKVRQEAAAVAHAVPHLTRLASAPAQVHPCSRLTTLSPAWTLAPFMCGTHCLAGLA